MVMVENAKLLASHRDQRGENIPASTWVRQDTSRQHDHTNVARQTPKRRAQRASRACDFCHSRSIRCRPGEGGRGPCQCCVEYTRTCTYHRPVKKRGVKAHSQPVLTGVPHISLGQRSPVLDGPSRTLDDLNHNTRAGLTEIYGEIVYPSFPIFHLPTLFRRIQAEEYLYDPAFCAVSTALCALVRARMRDGALLSENWATFATTSMPSCEALASAAASMIPRHAEAAENFDHIRAVCLLALLAVQGGNIKEVRFYLGFYHTLIRVNGLTDERCWPTNLSRTQVEERRRVIWAMYKLEVFAAVCFDSPSSAFPDGQNKVNYPEEISDETLDSETFVKQEDGLENQPLQALPVTNQAGDLNWLQGWNFVTDLYRVLQYAMARQQQSDYGCLRPSTVEGMFGSLQNPSQSMVLSEVTHFYHCLPQRFKEVRPMTFDSQQDRYSFQAMDISTTMQLVRLVLFTPNPTSYRDQSTILEEVCHTLLQVPMGYLKAMSVPLLYQLVGMGYSLHATLKDHTIYEVAERIRCTLLTLSILLSRLGSEVSIGEGPSDCIRKYVNHLDLPGPTLELGALTTATGIQTPSDESDASPCSSTSPDQNVWEGVNSLTSSTEFELGSGRLSFSSDISGISESFECTGGEASPLRKQEDWSQFFEFAK